jgi:hypothetical protein
MTLQEKFREVKDDPRWFHLHRTGVFYRQETAR